MISGKSLYRCPVCGNETKATPGIRIGCIRCNSVMQEVKKGAVTKDSPKRTEK